MRDYDALVERLARLEAAEAVRAVYATYTRAVDDFDAATLATIFADDIVMRNPKEKRGPDVLDHYRAFFSSGVEAPRHYVLNLDVRPESAHAATARAYYLVTTAIGSESHLGWGSYDDRLERREGRWVFVLKQNLPSRYATLAGGWAQPSDTRPWASS